MLEASLSSNPSKSESLPEGLLYSDLSFSSPFSLLPSPFPLRRPLSPPTYFYCDGVLALIIGCKCLNIKITNTRVKLERKESQMSMKVWHSSLQCPRPPTRTHMDFFFCLRCHPLLSLSSSQIIIFLSC